eukprot:SAG11_NODE_1999_length_3940_cov_2.297347_5_plen_126_part_00
MFNFFFRSKRASFLGAMAQLAKPAGVFKCCSSARGKHKHQHHKHRGETEFSQFAETAPDGEFVLQINEARHVPTRALRRTLSLVSVRSDESDLKPHCYVSMRARTVGKGWGGSVESWIVLQPAMD